MVGRPVKLCSTIFFAFIYISDKSNGWHFALPALPEHLTLWSLPVRL
jgi:hypothetical protein